MPISKVDSIRLEYTCCRSSLAHLTPVSLSFELGKGGDHAFLPLSAEEVGFTVSHVPSGT